MDKGIIKKVAKTVLVGGVTYVVGYVAGSIKAMKYLCESREAMGVASEIMREAEEALDLAKENCCYHCCDCDNKNKCVTDEDDKSTDKKEEKHEDKKVNHENINGTFVM